MDSDDSDDSDPVVWCTAPNRQVELADSDDSDDTIICHVAPNIQVDTPSTLGGKSVTAEKDVASYSKGSSDGSGVRSFDSTTRDQVWSYFSIVNQGGSFAHGGIFLCNFCKKKRFNWNTGFNITIAKDHLRETCLAVSSEAKEWLVDLHNCKNSSKSKKMKASTVTESMAKFIQPNCQKSVLDRDVARRIIASHIEMFLSFFDSPVRVLSPFTLKALTASCGSGIRQHIPTKHEVWKIVEEIDKNTSEFMVNRLKLEPGNLTVGFDGVTAIGRHATLYTFSKGVISLFLTIRYV